MKCEASKYIGLEVNSEKLKLSSSLEIRMQYIMLYSSYSLSRNVKLKLPGTYKPHARGPGA